MTNEINWMIEKAQTIETLEDGTVTRIFEGKIPAAMARKIKAAGTSRRDSGRTVTYSASGDVYGWSATFGASIGTANGVKFVYNDYTVPASK